MGMRLDQEALEAKALANNIALKEQLALSHKRMAEGQAEANVRWRRLAGEAKWPIARWLLLRWANKGEARVAKCLHEQERYSEIVQKLKGER